MLLQKTSNFFKSNLFKYISADFLSVAIGFTLASYILLELGAKELGIFSLYLLLIGLYSSLSQGAANSYLMKNFFLQDKNETISSVNLTMLVFSIIAFLVYVMTYSAFQDYYLSIYFIAFAILKAFNSSTFVIMRLYEDANSYWIFSLLYKSFYGLIVLYFILYLTLDVETLVTILFYNEIGFLLILYGYLCYKYEYRFSYNYEYFKVNIQLSLKLFFHKIFKTFYENIDKYSIQILFGLEALGIYSMVVRLASPVGILIKASNNEFAVLMSKVFAKKENVSRLIQTEKKILFLLFFINIITTIFAYSYHFYFYNLGENFYAIFSLALLLVNSSVFYFAFYNLLFLRESKIVLFIMGINIFMFISLNFLWGDSMLKVISLLLVSNVISNFILFFTLGKHNILQIIKYLFLPFSLMSLLIIGSLVW